MSRTIRRRRKSKKPKLLGPGDKLFVITDDKGLAISKRQVVHIHKVMKGSGDSCFIFPEEYKKLQYNYYSHYFSRTKDGPPLTKEDFDV